MSNFGEKSFEGRRANKSHDASSSPPGIHADAVRYRTTNFAVREKESLLEFCKTCKWAVGALVAPRAPPLV